MRGWPKHRFAVERAKLGPARFPAHFAAAPDVVAGLFAVADELRHPPGPLDREMRAVAMIKAGERVEKLARQIEVIEPIGKKAGAPRLARIAAKPVRAPARQAGQLEMVL